MDISLQTHWGWQIATYLFLGGLGAGTLFVVSYLELKYKEVFQKTVCFGAWAGMGCLAIGTALLLFEVSMPLRALLMWKSFTNFSSWMTIGAWLLFSGILFSGIFALVKTKPVVKLLPGLQKIARPLAAILLVYGVGIAAYTGILLSVCVAHPLWNTALLPVLFVVSAMDTGVALTTILTGVEASETPELQPVRRGFEKTTLILVVLEVITLCILFVTVNAQSEVGAISVGILLSGRLATVFWVVFVGIGICVPGLVAGITLLREKPGHVVPAAEDSVTTSADLKVKTNHSRALPVIAAVCCLVGGCVLRFLILLAGIPVSLV